MKFLPCPFCGSTDITHNEILGCSSPGSGGYAQSQCDQCGALGARGELPPGKFDDLLAQVAASVEGWNQRVAIVGDPAECDEDGEPT